MDSGERQDAETREQPMTIRAQQLSPTVYFPPRPHEAPANSMVADRKV